MGTGESHSMFGHSQFCLVCRTERGDLWWDRWSESAEERIGGTERRRRRGERSRSKNGEGRVRKGYNGKMASSLLPGE